MGELVIMVHMRFCHETIGLQFNTFLIFSYKEDIQNSFHNELVGEIKVAICQDNGNKEKKGHPVPHRVDQFWTKHRRL